MASVDKVKVGSTTYNISPSKDGTLTGFTSNDAASPSAWSAVNTITTSDTNSSIFSKITTMVKNVRWLYNKLGQTDFSSTGQSTVTGALKSLQTSVNGKAAASHSHTTADLPVSSTQTNSTSYIPTSALVYSMQQQITSLNDALSRVSNKLDNVNERAYSTTNLGTWSSISNVDTFLNRFNCETAYKDGDIELSVGNCITIQDGTYNSVWQIAGFDVEHNIRAADGTMYDNGYGIMLIPQNYISLAKWNNSDSVRGGYISSNIHTSFLPTAITTLKNVLGSHAVNRNVLLSSSVDDNCISNAYTWTNSHATLMGIGQVTGRYSEFHNRYDDGEATYRLPLFRYQNCYIGRIYWVRSIWGQYWDESDSNWHRYAYYINNIQDIFGNNYYGTTVNVAQPIRPIIYIR